MSQTCSSQAFNAIHGHAQNTREPTALELDLIKEFQQKDSRFFSSDALRDFANGGPPPQLPPGTTESEQARAGDVRQCAFRWRDDERALQLVSLRTDAEPVRSGQSFRVASWWAAVPASPSRERNLIGNPVYSFAVTNPDGSVVVIATRPTPARC